MLVWIGSSSAIVLYLVVVLDSTVAFTLPQLSFCAVNRDLRSVGDLEVSCDGRGTSCNGFCHKRRRVVCFDYIFGRSDRNDVKKEEVRREPNDEPEDWSLSMISSAVEEIKDIEKINTSNKNGVKEEEVRRELNDDPEDWSLPMISSAVEEIEDIENIDTSNKNGVKEEEVRKEPSDVPMISSAVEEIEDTENIETSNSSADTKSPLSKENGSLPVMTSTVDDTDTNTDNDSNSETDDGISDPESPPSPPPKPKLQEVPQPGIGGQGGIVYDVNKLKRNLIQEAVRRYKSELVDMLHNAPSSTTPYDEASSVVVGVTPAIAAVGTTPTRREIIGEKIAGLVESNPVSTTTDSNLLQGAWSFTFLAEEASTILSDSMSLIVRGGRVNGVNGERGVDIDTALGQSTEYRENLAAEERFWNSGPWNVESDSASSSNPLQTSTRFFNLEDLEEDEDPYVVDKTEYWNGLWTVERRYDVVGLTRTTLELKLNSISMFLCGKLIRMKEGVAGGIEPGTVGIKVFYLDSSLFIASMLSRERDNLMIYTRDTSDKDDDGGGESIDRGVGTISMTKVKNLPFLISAVSYLASKESPFKIRRKIGRFTGITKLTTFCHKNLFSSSNPSNSTTSLPNDNVLQNSAIRYKRCSPTTDENVTVWRLGSLSDDSDNSGGTTTTTWVGEEDPFFDLDPEERQEKMKGMSLAEIEEAGEKQRKIVRARRRKEYRMQKTFKRPS